MSNSHPYWAYGGDHGQAVAEAIDEGRRAAALELAVAGSFTFTDEEAVDRALKFEAFLKGEVSVTVVDTTEYEALVKRSNRLLVLEQSGEVFGAE